MQGSYRGRSYRAHLLALEPRMMFDAAAVAVVREAMTSDANAGSADAPADKGEHAAPGTDHAPSPSSRAAPVSDRGDRFSPAPVETALSDRTLVDNAAARSHDWRTPAAPDAVAPPARDIIFIDTSVDDYRQLAAEWADRGEVVLIDGTRDGIDQMRSALAGRSAVAAIHIVTHGSAGVLQIGTTRIDEAGITGELAGSLAAVGRALTPDGDILIYGCDFANGTTGARTLAAFAHVTGADVAASTDTTGYAARGGDWDLEARDGSIEARALSSDDWVHTLDPNTPVPISVTVNSLTVKDGTGTVVFSTANNYNNNAARSPDVGVGSVATWANASTFQGHSVDLRATIVSLTAGDAVQFNRVTGTGTGPDDPTFLLRDLTTGATPATVQVRWELIDSVTGQPLPADVRFTIADIDGIGGNPNTRETVTASTDNLAYFTREKISDINFTSSLNAIQASGTQDENNPTGATLTPKSAATFDWTKVSSFVLTYTLTPNANTTQAQFYHDGDADFVYSDPVYVSIPRLDLDGNDSTATGNDTLHTFTEGGAGVPIVDADLVVQNPMPSEGITGATIRLTNWHTGDTFTVGTLPTGLTASIGAVTGGTQTITIAGIGSETDYAAAFQAITFANGSDAPNTDQRVIQVTFSNDTLTSATAISRINVIPVNDVPVRVGTLPARTTTDAATVTYPTASGFSDPDGDVLAYSASGLPAGLSINSTTGAITGTINRSASQSNGGVYTVVVTATDPSNTSQTQTFTITVSNPPPDAVDDMTATLDEDTSTIIDVLANDTDPDGDPLSIISATALHGAVVVNAQNKLLYTADANYNGPDTVTYTISDGEGGTDTAIVAITVTPVNDPVVATGTLPARSSQDALTVNYPTAGGFADADGEPLTYSATGLPIGLAINGVTGLISGTIDRSASQPGGGVYTIVVTARDAANSTATQTFTLTVTNPVPNAVNDTATTAEDTPVTIAVLGNDADPDGDPLTVTSASALHGGVVRNLDGTLTYTPDADYNGPDTITYTISDGQGGTDAATVAVTVTPVNDAPIAVGTLPDRTGADSSSASFATAGGFGDPEGQALTYSATGLPAGLTIDSVTGIISGTIDRAASQPGGGLYTVVVTARDPGNATATRSFTYTVTNPPPTAADDSATTAEDTPVTIAVLTNDNDPDGDPLTVTAASALHGTVVRNPDGTLTYTPNADYNGADTISYTIADGNGGTANAIVAVTITPVNDGPTAVGTLPSRNDADGATVSFGTAAGFDDPEGDAVTYAASGLPTGLSIDATTGIVSGTIGRSASQLGGGSYLVTITATDTFGAASAQTFIYAVANPGPVAVDDSTTTVEDTPVTFAVLPNDGDPDGDPLTVVAASALHGTVTINPDGTLTYNPAADYNGPDMIAYTISDGEGGTAIANVAITVTPVDDAPVPVGSLSARNGVDGGTVSFGTAGGFADPDGDVLTYSATGLPTGLAIDAATGIISGTIDRSASQAGGGTYAVVVTARDPLGLTTTQTFTYNVTNTAPTTVNDSATTAEDTPVVIAVLGNDSDPDGDPLSVVAATALHGTVTINPDFTLTYTPDANYNGADTISYTINDGQGGTASAMVSVTVTGGNDAPVAVGTLPARKGLDGAAASIPTAAGFFDLDGDTLNYAATGLPIGLTIDAATGVISGTIDRSASQLAGGVYTVVVTARDPSNATATQSFTITAVNPGPTAVNDMATTSHDRPVDIVVLANDSDSDGDPLIVTSASATTGTVTIRPDDSIRYTPVAGFIGTDTITYTISDGQGGTATATVQVEVTNAAPTATPAPGVAARDGDTVSLPIGTQFSDADGDPLTFAATGLPPGLAIDPLTGTVSGVIARSASQTNGGGYDAVVTVSDGAGGITSLTLHFDIANPGPIARDDSATTAEDTPVTIAVLGNDTDPDGDPLVVTAATALHGVVTINLDGTLTYRPDADYNGADTITYTIGDGQGGISTATVALTVTPVNDAPTTIGLPPRTAVDGGAVSVPTAGGFADVEGGPLTFAATGLPPGLTIDPATGVVSGTIVPGSVVGGPAGDGRYLTTITVTDPQGAEITTTFAFTVTRSAPVARDDAAVTTEDTPVTIPVLANDSDADNDPLTIVSATVDSGSVRIVGGELVYTPAPDFSGVATITYVVTDPSGTQATATVIVNVTPVDDAPRAQPIPAQSGRDGAPITFDASTFFIDPDGDSLTFAATGLPPGLTVDSVTGRISGTIDRNASAIAGGVYRVTITATDGTLATVASFDWAIANPPPVAVDDVARTLEDTPVVIPVLGNDGDPDGDPLTIVSATAGRGVVTIGNDGRLTYTPGPDFAGNDVITYTISDGNGGQSTARVTVTIDPVNDQPVIPPQDGAIRAIGGRPITIDPLRGTADPDGDPQTIVAATTVNGAVAINPDGTLRFTPTLGFVGTTTISYRISDGRGGLADGVLVIDVRADAVGDIEELLRIGRVTLVDPLPALATITVTDGEIRNPLSLLDTVEAIRGLNTTRIGQHAVGDAVDAIRALNGTFVDPDQPVTAEVARLDRLTDRRDAGDRLFDHRWSDFDVRSLTGFSTAADRNAGIMVESVVRDGAIYLEVRDIAQDGRAAIRAVDVRTATGGRAPDWIKVDRRGLAIVERGAGTDELHLIVRVTRADGRISNTPIVIQGATGEIELDRHHGRTHGRAAPLDLTLQTPAALQQAIAARLASSFE